MAAKKKLKSKKEGTIYESFSLNDTNYLTLYTLKFQNRKKYEEKDPKRVIAFIPGKIKKIYVKNGSRVKEGDKLFVLEAMKMNNTLFSPMKGTIKEVYVTIGISVPKDALLLEFE
jgi:biotin carboxyl carrier protein